MWVSVVSSLCQSGVSFRRKYLCHSYWIFMVKRVAFVGALVQTQILEKPLDKEDATRMLTSLSGKAAYHLILSFQGCLLMQLVVMWTTGMSLWVIQGSKLQRSESHECHVLAPLWWNLGLGRSSPKIQLFSAGFFAYVWEVSHHMLSSSTKVYGKLSSCRSGCNLLGYHYSSLFGAEWCSAFYDSSAT